MSQDHRVTCDVCGQSTALLLVFPHGVPEYRLPAGWVNARLDPEHPAVDLCPDCIEARRVAATAALDERRQRSA